MAQRRLAALALGCLLGSLPALAELPIRGRVLLPDGTPAAGVGVRLMPLSGPVERALSLASLAESGSMEPLGPPLATAISGTDGLFHLSAPGPGMVRVLVEAEGFVPMTFHPPGLAPLLEATDLPTLALEAARRVRVRVTRPTGRGRLAGVLVVVAARTDCRRWCPAERFGRTGSRGWVNLPLGYDEESGVRAWAPGFRESELLSTTDGTLDLPLRQGLKRTLVVRERDGQAAAGACVLVGEGDWPGGVTGEDGRVGVVLPSRGEMPILLADCPGRGHRGRRHSPSLASAAEAGAKELFLDFESVERKLLGRVLAASGDLPLTTAFVWPAGRPDLAAPTDEAGRYAVPLPHITADLAIAAAAPGHLPTAISLFRDGPEAAGRLDLVLEPAAELEGRVVNPQGHGIPLAEVNVYSRGPRIVGIRRIPLGTARTDEGGRFRLAALRPEHLVQVDAEAPGFLLARQPTPIPRGEALVLVLEPARHATGQVVDRDLQPVADAEVRLVASGHLGRSRYLRGNDGAGAEGWTSPDGRFDLHPLAVGFFDLIVFRRGFERTLVRGVEVLEAATTDLGTLVLEPGASLKGVVRDPAGRPVVGARVEPISLAAPLRLSDGSDDLGGTTDGEGNFALTELRWGERLDLDVTHPGFVDRRLPKVVVPNAELLEIELQPSARVVGEVRGRGGRPVTGAVVRLLGEHREGSAGPDEWGDATDETGRFEIPQVTPGPLRLVVTAEGYPPLLRPLTVQAEADPTPLRLILEEGAAFEGRLTTAEGMPVAEAAVRVVEVEGALASLRRRDLKLETRSGPDGRYRLEGIPPGAVELLASADGFPVVTHRTTAAAGVNLLDFVFPSGVVVAGRVVDSQGRPTSVALVRMMPEGGGTMRSVRSSPRGQFSFSAVVDGSYRLSALALTTPQLSPEVPVTVSDRDLSDIVLTLEGGDSQGEDRPGRIVGTLEGLVFEEIAEVEIVAVHEIPAQVQQGVVDFQGRYRFDALVPGRWTVTAVLVSRGREAQGVVTLEPGREAQLDLAFGTGLSLTGTVLRAAEPVGRATVKLLGVEQPVERITETGYDGRFTLEDLSPGSYRLLVIGAGRRLLDQQKVDLAVDRDLVIRLSDGSLTVRVSAAETGEPLEGARLTLQPQDRVLRGGSASTPAVTDAYGEATLAPLPPDLPGGWHLRAEREGYSTRLLEISVGDGGAGFDVPLERSAGLLLEIQNAHGAPVTAVQVSVLDSAGVPVVFGQYSAGADGRVNLPGVGAGRWWLVVSGDAGLARQTVEVPGPPVSLRLQPTGRLQIFVPELVETPARAEVEFVGADGRPLEILNRRGRGGRRRPLRNGMVTVDQVPAGAWRIVIRAADGRRWQQEVTVIAGTTLEVEL